MSQVELGIGTGDAKTFEVGSTFGRDFETRAVVLVEALISEVYDMYRYVHDMYRYVYDRCRYS
jgi:hypothetical protein